MMIGFLIIFYFIIRLYNSRNKIIHGEYLYSKDAKLLNEGVSKYFEFLKLNQFSYTDFIRSLNSETKRFKLKKSHCEKYQISIIMLIIMLSLNYFLKMNQMIYYKKVDCAL